MKEEAVGMTRQLTVEELPQHVFSTHQMQQTSPLEQVTKTERATSPKRSPRHSSNVNTLSLNTLSRGLQFTNDIMPQVEHKEEENMSPATKLLEEQNK